MTISQQEFEALQPTDTLIDCNGHRWDVIDTEKLPSGNKRVMARSPSGKVLTLRHTARGGMNCIARNLSELVMELSHASAQVHRPSA
ncbi:hypothetical protein HN358_04400 [Candidatus Uhrbacteria bacterium]|nr:hypothetical protein [Candidatus Uhrbacteria bacterium]MBT7717024.1 hypothetical protein [Candidatus Uhrbacteria bacterium]